MITTDEFARRMDHIAADKSDPERAHYSADNLMMQVLAELGYGEGTEIFKEMGRFYS